MSAEERAIHLAKIEVARQAAEDAAHEVTFFFSLGFGLFFRFCSLSFVFYCCLFGML